MELVVHKNLAEANKWHDGQTVEILADKHTGPATVRVVGNPLPPLFGGSAPEPPPPNGYCLPYGHGVGKSIGDIPSDQLAEVLRGRMYQDYPALEAAIQRELSRRAFHEGKT